MNNFNASYYDDNGYYEGRTCKECGTFIMEPTMTSTTTFVDGSKDKYQELKKIVNETLKKLGGVEDELDEILDGLCDDIDDLEYNKNVPHNR